MLALLSSVTYRESEVPSSFDLDNCLLIASKVSKQELEVYKQLTFFTENEVGKYLDVEKGGHEFIFSEKAEKRFTHHIVLIP